MVSKKQQRNNLNDFFKDEYHSLKGYVRSKIKHTTDSDAEDIIQDVALKIFSRPSDAIPINNPNVQKTQGHIIIIKTFRKK